MATESVKDRLSPPVVTIRAQLENRARFPRATPTHRHAVKVTGCVEDDRARNMMSVPVIVTEVVDDVLAPPAVPIRTQLENRALVMRTTRAGSAEDITGRIKDQSSRTRAVMTIVLESCG
jgi:hypothetical protein